MRIKKSKQKISKRQLQEIKRLRKQQFSRREKIKKQNFSGVKTKQYGGKKYLVKFIDGKIVERVKAKKGWTKEDAVKHNNKFGSINQDVHVFTWERKDGLVTTERTFYGKKRNVGRKEFQAVVEADVLTKSGRWKHVGARSDKKTAQVQGWRAAIAQARNRFYGIVTYEVFQDSNKSRYDDIPSKRIKNYSEGVVTYRREEQQKL